MEFFTESVATDLVINQWQEGHCRSALSGHVLVKMKHDLNDVLRNPNICIDMISFVQTSIQIVST